MLIINGSIIRKKKRLEIPSTRPRETVMPPKAEIKHIGGGWYKVRGRKVRGKKAAEVAMKAGD